MAGHERTPLSNNQVEFLQHWINGCSRLVDIAKAMGISVGYASGLEDEVWLKLGIRFNWQHDRDTEREKIVQAIQMRREGIPWKQIAQALGSSVNDYQKVCASVGELIGGMGNLNSPFVDEILRSE